MVGTEEIVQWIRQRNCRGRWSEENQGTATMGQLKVPGAGAGAEEGAQWERERWGGGAGPFQSCWCSSEMGRLEGRVDTRRNGEEN